MGLRLHRLTEEQWQRLAAARRSQDLAGPPARATIGAIEVELRSLDRIDPGSTQIEPPREAAAG